MKQKKSIKKSIVMIGGGDQSIFLRVNKGEKVRIGSSYVIAGETYEENKLRHEKRLDDIVKQTKKMEKKHTKDTIRKEKIRILKQKLSELLHIKNNASSTPYKIQKLNWIFNEIEENNMLTIDENGIIQKSENIGLIISYDNPEEIDNQLIGLHVSSLIDLIKEYGNDPNFGLIIPSSSYMFFDYYKDIYKETDINKIFPNVIEYNNDIKKKGPVKTLGPKPNKERN